MCSLSDTALTYEEIKATVFMKPWAVLICFELCHIGRYYRAARERDFHYQATRSLMHIFKKKSPKGRHSKRQSPAAEMLFWILIPLVHTNSAYPPQRIIFRSDFSMLETKLRL